MMKKSIFILVFSFVTFFVFSEKLAIAPVVIYNQNNVKEEITGNPQKEIYNELNNYWFKGLLFFESLKETDYGYVYTILDANKVCIGSNSDYLLYGYIQKNELTWYANFKIYKLSEYRIVKEIFTTDSIEKYDRFIKTLSLNLIDELNDISGNDLDQKIAEKYHPVTLKIPVSTYYWSPVTKQWNSVMTGIIGASFGLEIYPPLPQFVCKSNLFTFSSELEIAYSYAFGKKDSYPLNFNDIQIITPIIAHMDFNEQHSIYTGIGPFYSMEMLNIVEKYKAERFVFQNMFGLEFLIGYEFNINDIVYLKSKTCFDMHFNNDKFLTVKSGICVSFKVLEK